MNEMSPADVSAVLGNRDGFGNGGAWWLIILFLFCFMGNGWNGNRGDYGQYATAASQQEILFGQQFQNLDNKMDRLGNGIADATFALNNSIHNAQDTVAGAVINEGRGVQTQIASEARGFQQQIGDGFCGTNRNIDALRTDTALTKGEIMGAIREDGDKTRALIQQNEIQAMRDKIASLEMDNRMCGVVRYPMSYAYSAGNSPFCGCNRDCGC